MDEGTKMELAYEEGSAGSARVAKVWRFWPESSDIYLD